ncbi:hypothetical protein DBB34_05350 [Sphaerisporangium cinnabarinum]|nr:hypothetical protein [Sphaerisporangium cinnabarinum]PTU57173.1 hypothetical protein DBB34_05350 [Sphaerisporangium cinnabarinum]
MQTLHHPPASRDSGRPRRFNLISVAVLFVAIVATALMLIGIAERGTNPGFILIPVAVAVVAILDIRER